MTCQKKHREYCNGKDLRLVVMKIQSNPKNVYGGTAIYMCPGMQVS